MKGKKRRNLIALVVAVLVLFTVSSVAYAHMEKTGMKVSVDGISVEEEIFYHTELFRVFVSADSIAKALGGSASYTPDTKTVTVKVGSNNFVSVIGEKKVSVDGVVIPVDSGARLVQDVPVLPVRSLVEALGGGVKWDGQSGTIQVFGPLQVELLPTGHWHVYKEKKLTFKVTSLSSGTPVKGLELAARMTGLNGWTRANSVAGGTVVDNEDGTYTTSFTPMEAGSEYIHSYAVAIQFPYAGHIVNKSWPVETTRDGPEGIVKEGTNGKTHAYQVRSGWQVGDIYADDEKAVTMLFEPMKSVQEGDQINRAQPFRNTFSHLPSINANVVVKSVDGAVSEEILATYKGKGVYSATRVFTKAEAEGGREYLVSFVFTDPDTGAVIGPEDNLLPLKVLPLAAVTGSAQQEPDASHGEATAAMRLADGKRFFESNCATCHALPTNEKIRGYKSDAELRKVVDGMGNMSGLAQVDIDKIFEYLDSLRH